MTIPMPLVNALIHQDFEMSGAGPMVEIFSDRMEITNPGEPLVETLRFIDSPPHSRNEILASLMRRMNICEERGTGIDKVIEAVELFQLPAPDFTTPLGFTKATLFAHQNLNDMDSSARTRACYQHACLCFVTGQKMTNASVRSRFGIDAKNAAKASRIIKEAVKAGSIKLRDPEVRDRDRNYVPFWA
jgi:ATP-dependent DNA helicase RecG